MKITHNNNSVNKFRMINNSNNNNRRLIPIENIYNIPLITSKKSSKKMSIKRHTGKKYYNTHCKSLKEMIMSKSKNNSLKRKKITASKIDKTCRKLKKIYNTINGRTKRKQKKIKKIKKTK
jgi:hypothetical protein